MLYKRLAASASAMVVLLLITVFLAGCGPKVNYPKAKVTSPLNRPGVCAACRKKIESVAEKNVFVYANVQYVVCDEKCAAKMKKLVDSQNEDSPR
jgi:hypothetical protein